MEGYGHGIFAVNNVKQVFPGNIACCVHISDKVFVGGYEQVVRLFNSVKLVYE